MSLQKIPATVITGFLGAGKTTLVRNLLEQARGRRIALIINEFGDAGIDGEILKGCGDALCREEDVIELSNGCICCTVAEDFVPVMKKLIERRDPPEHIVIETSGLALPQPLVRAFNWPEIKARVTVDCVITVVDGKALSEGRFAGDEAAVAAQRAADPSLVHENPIEELFEDQLNCADLVIVNKADLLSTDELAGVEVDLRSRARSGARLIPARNAAVDITALLGVGAQAEGDLGNRLSHHEMEGELQHDHDGFTSFVVRIGAASERGALLERIDRVLAAHDILRLKGFASVPGSASRLLIQAVGQRLTSYFDRVWKPGETRATELVVIGQRGIDRAAISKALGG